MKCSELGNEHGEGQDPYTVVLRRKQNDLMRKQGYVDRLELVLHKLAKQSNADFQ